MLRHRRDLPAEVVRGLASFGATDFVLGLVLLIGLSLSTVVVLLFGPTPAVVASFAWIVALSFVATGLLLLEVASCERSGAPQ